MKMELAQALFDLGGMYPEQNVYPMQVAEFNLSAARDGDILLEDAMSGRRKVIFRRNGTPSERWKWCVIHVDGWGDKQFSLALSEADAVKMAEGMIAFSGGSAYVTTREKIFGD